MPVSDVKLSIDGTQGYYKPFQNSMCHKLLTSKHVKTGISYPGRQNLSGRGRWYIKVPENKVKARGYRNGSGKGSRSSRLAGNVTYA